MHIISVLDLVALLDNVWYGSCLPDKVGFEHEYLTLEKFLSKLNRGIFIQRSMLEECLFSCLLLCEEGKFRHPFNLSFEQFVKKLLNELNYSERTGLIYEKAKERHETRKLRSFCATKTS